MQLADDAVLVQLLGFDRVHAVREMTFLQPPSVVSCRTREQYSHKTLETRA